MADSLETTSAIDLVERLQHLVLAEKTLGQPLALPGGDLAIITEAADTITRLQAALESAVATLRRTHDDIILGCEREDTLTNINAEIRNLRSSVGGE